MGPGRFRSGSLLAAVMALAAARCTVGGGGEAQQSAQAITNCAPLELDPARLVRQLSLDLRGTPPTFDEVQAAVNAGQVSTATIDAMLQTPEFLDQVKAWHGAILWPNIDGQNVRVSQLVMRGSSVGPNPELTVDLLDARTNETTCPTTGTGQLTAAVCCTAAMPNNPACCMVRNATFNASDPACIAKASSPLIGAAYRNSQVFNDKGTRGGTGTGCDPTLEYPPDHVALSDTRWTHDASGRPYYTSPRSGHPRFYYDSDNIPLPYDDWTHCPAYCRSATPNGPMGTYLQTDYVQKQRMVGGHLVLGDAVDAVCPAGFVEIANNCDNHPPPVPSDFENNLRIRREGYRLVSPYWATGHLVKVCAYDALERTTSVYTNAPCLPGNQGDPSCGCGPNGNFCEPAYQYAREGVNAGVPFSRTQTALHQSLNEEPLEIVASVVGRDEDYYNSYTTRRSFVNGRLTYLYRNQMPAALGLGLTDPAPVAMLPDVPFGDTTWHEYDRGPQHAGVLTTPAYLGRFPTWRSRINRFRTALLCRPFTPPAGGLPSPDDACNREPNLARRCGCQHCHTAIEPLGAYWGRWAQRSAQYLDPQTFPAFDPECALCATSGQFCSPRCQNNYVTSTTDSDGARYAGTLLGYLYRTPEETPRIEQGPAALVANALSTGEMQACTVNTLWTRLLGRPMSDQETQQVLPGLVQDFEANHHNYRSLVRAIVTTPAYRRID